MVKALSLGILLFVHLSLEPSKKDTIVAQRVKLPVDLMLLYITITPKDTSS